MVCSVPSVVEVCFVVVDGVFVVTTGVVVGFSVVDISGVASVVDT